LVKFFNKPRSITDKRKSKSTSSEPEPTPAATRSTAAPPAKKAPVRRRTPVRPPRRDWAAEAAATPVDAPAPLPASLAASPADDEEGPGGVTKRRRGTRGGRGRKKPGANGDGAAQIVELPKQPPASLEAVVARQAAVLENFAADVTSTLKGLQAAVAGLQMRLEQRPSAAKAHPRVGIFVDVPNLIYAAERRGVAIDFGRVLDYFTRDRELVRASAYAPITDDPQAKLESQRFVHHFLGHPYRIITKPLKRFADGSMKANFDIELAIDILTMSDRLDVVVLMSGDGDFRRLVELVASRGVRVEVVAFSETASADLKAVADLYVDIGAHLDEFRVQK
jgi:uncharacterized LabA/DUF88 family protein